MVDFDDLLQDAVHVGGLHADAGQIQLGQEGREKHHHIVPDQAQTLLQRSVRKTCDQSGVRNVHFVRTAPKI